MNKTALARARERRRALDRDRDVQDQRIEEATATTLVALEHLAETEEARTAASVMVGQALGELLAEDVSHERAAALLELDVSEVRRLSKVATVATAIGGAVGHAGSRPAAARTGSSDSHGAPPAALRPDPTASEDPPRRAG